MESLEDGNIYIKFLPPNMTSKLQPDDMEIIYTFKVGYKTIILISILDIFYEEGGY